MNELELCGTTIDHNFTGHVLLAGRRIAAISIVLPDDFWKDDVSLCADAAPKRKRGRPKGESSERKNRDLKFLAAYEIVEAVLKRDGRECGVKVAQKCALALAATNGGSRGEYEQDVSHATTNDRQLRQNLKDARDALSTYRTQVDVSAGDPSSWHWCAVASNGSAYLYFWRGDVIPCQAQPGSKSGAIQLTPLPEQNRTK